MSRSSGVQSTAHAAEKTVVVKKVQTRSTFSSKSGEEPKCDTVTMETVETFHDGTTGCYTSVTGDKDAFKNFPSHLQQALKDAKPGETKVTKITSPTSGSPSLSGKKPGKAKDSSAKAVRTTKDRSSSSESSSDDEDFANDCLKAHNEYRKLHKVPPLKLNKELNAYSKEWVQKIAKEDAVRHRAEKKYGENIYCMWSSNPKFKVSGKDAVESWYSEIKDHTFGQEPSTLKSGHFSQVVWKDSREMGVSKARTKSNKVIVVANYDPAGNYLGEFAASVPPVGGFTGKPDSSTKPEAKPERKKGSLFSKLRGKKGESSSDSSSSSDEEDFRKECVRVHNEYRKKHGVPDLTLSKELCKYSHEWVKKLAKEDKMQHRQDHKYGENIYCAYSSDPKFKVTGKDPCENWYNEIKDHPFGQEPRTLKSGHFSQMVWKQSKELGVSKARSKSGKILVVANYNPAGNFVGKFAENVPRPK